MSEDYVKVAELKDLGTLSMKAVEVDGETVCVINLGGNYYAVKKYVHSPRRSIE